MPSWYPDEIYPFNGIFIKEQGRAAQLYNNILILHIYSLPILKYFKIKKFLPETVISQGIKTIKIRVPGIFILRNILQVILSFLMFIKINTQFKVDIIHSHIVLPMGFIGVVLGKVFKIPVLLSEHTGPFSAHMTNFVKKILVKYTMRNVKSILVVSEYLQKQIENFNISNKFEIIANTVDTEFFKPKKLIKSKDKKIMLLTVSSLIPLKGTEYLIRAVSSLKNKFNNFILNIIGDGPCRGQYKQLCFKLGVEDVIKFHKAGKTRNKIADFLDKCDFFISPSLSETFGVVLIEAMACGKPVVATNCGGPVEFVKKDAGIIVNPGNVKELKKGIEFMLRNYQKFNKNKIRLYVLNNFSFKVIGKKIDSIYKRIKWN